MPQTALTFFAASMLKLATGKPGNAAQGTWFAPDATSCRPSAWPSGCPWLQHSVASDASEASTQSMNAGGPPFPLVYPQHLLFKGRCHLNMEVPFNVPWHSCAVAPVSLASPTGIWGSPECFFELIGGRLRQNIRRIINLQGKSFLGSERASLRTLQGAGARTAWPCSVIGGRQPGHTRKLRLWPLAGEALLLKYLQKQIRRSTWIERRA